MKIGWQ